MGSRNTADVLIYAGQGEEQDTDMVLCPTSPTETLCLLCSSDGKHAIQENIRGSCVISKQTTGLSS